MKNIIIIGGGGHAKVIISMIKKIQTLNLLGYTDLNNNGDILGVKYLGSDDIIETYDTNIKLVLGIGQIKNVVQRKRIVKTFLKKGYDFEYIISPDAIINEDVIIQPGSVIMDNAVIQSGTKIGQYCIINTNASIDHDCIINDFTHIAPGTTVCGSVAIGKECLIGAGSTIINNMTIGDHCIIGAGSTVIKSIGDHRVFYGMKSQKNGNDS